MNSKHYSLENQDLQDIPDFKEGPPDQLNLSHNKLMNLQVLVFHISRF